MILRHRQDAQMQNVYCGSQFEVSFLMTLWVFSGIITVFRHPVLSLNNNVRTLAAVQQQYLP